jgi:spore coat polysaccharide biosynthesis protein SpsF
MTSSRLPGKVLLPVGGKPLLQILVERVKRARYVDEIVIATTLNSQDDALETLARELEIGFYRGSEEDVLARVLFAADKYDAETIVELTGDCPLVDPELIDQCILTYRNNTVDYLSNGHIPGYPIGLDVQVFSRSALYQSHKEGLTPEDREHVSWYMRRCPELFKQLHLAPPPTLYWPDLRLTLDEEADYLFLKAVLSHFRGREVDVDSYEILSFLREREDLLKINAMVKEKTID